MAEVTSVHVSYTKGPYGSVESLSYDEEEYKEGLFDFNQVIREAIEDGGKVITLEVRVEQ
jgi:hypothetical protein